MTILNKLTREALPKFQGFRKGIKNYIICSFSLHIKIWLALTPS